MLGFECASLLAGSCRLDIWKSDNLSNDNVALSITMSHDSTNRSPGLVANLQVLRVDPKVGKDLSVAKDPWIHRR